mgnify:CR=1 FL=1
MQIVSTSITLAQVFFLKNHEKVLSWNSELVTPASRFYVLLYGVWCYELLPLEKVTSLFWLYPNVMSSLNSDRLQMLVIFYFFRNLMLITGIPSRIYPECCHHQPDEACSISTFSSFNFLSRPDMFYALRVCWKHI